jgi:hypothetical protein
MYATVFCFYTCSYNTHYTHVCKIPTFTSTESRHFFSTFKKSGVLTLWRESYQNNFEDLSKNLLQHCKKKMIKVDIILTFSTWWENKPKIFFRHLFFDSITFHFVLLDLLVINTITFLRGYLGK